MQLPPFLLDRWLDEHRDAPYNLAVALLDRFFEEQAGTFAWVRPAGGFTGFPSLRDGTVARPFCERAALRGVLLAPGDCFGAPAHIRVGFGACEHGFAHALEILADLSRALVG